MAIARTLRPADSLLGQAPVARVPAVLVPRFIMLGR